MAREVILASYKKMYTYTLSVSGITSFTMPPASSGIGQTEKVQVQAASTNTAAVLVGPSTISADYNNGGIELLPGSSTVLYFNLDEDLRAIAISGTQKLLVSYFSGANG